MQLTNDQLGYIKSLGVLKTPIQDIPLLLDLSFEDGELLIKELKDEKSNTYRVYQSGVLKGSVSIKRELYEKAKKADTFALDGLENIQKSEVLTNLKKDLFGI